MHNTMLDKTEKMLDKQTGSLSKLENEVERLKSQLDLSQTEKKDMEGKLTEVMLNVLEVNHQYHPLINVNINILYLSSHNKVGC